MASQFMVAALQQMAPNHLYPYIYIYIYVSSFSGLLTRLGTSFLVNRIKQR